MSLNKHIHIKGGWLGQRWRPEVQLLQKAVSSLEVFSLCSCLSKLLEHATAQNTNKKKTCNHQKCGKKEALVLRYCLASYCRKIQTGHKKCLAPEGVYIIWTYFCTNMGLLIAFHGVYLSTVCRSFLICGLQLLSSSYISAILPPAYGLYYTCVWKKYYYKSHTV